MSFDHCFHTIKARGIIVGSSLKYVFNEIFLENNYNIEFVWIINENDGSIKLSYTKNNNESYNSWLNVSCKAPTFLSRIKNPREHLLYIFTSGTTDLPKVRFFEFGLYYNKISVVIFLN